MTISSEPRHPACEQNHPTPLDGEIVVPLSKIIDFIIAQTNAIDRQVSELEQTFPDRFASGTVFVTHAGQVGIEAGKRLMLQYLAEGIVEAAVQNSFEPVPTPPVPQQRFPEEQP